MNTEHSTLATAGVQLDSDQLGVSDLDMEGLVGLQEGDYTLGQLGGYTVGSCPVLSFPVLSC